ncbi:MAG: stage III sporulation protein AE [Syntrophomonadaceae bacterium]
MKRSTFIIIILAILFTFINFSTLEAAEDEDISLLPQVIEKIDLGTMEDFKQQIDGEVSNYINHKSVKEWLLDFISGNWQLDTGEIMQNMGKYFWGEVSANFNLLGKLLVLSVLSALLINLPGAFSSGVSRIAQMACFMALTAIALGSFRLVLGIGQQTIDQMTSFMLGMLPQMLVLVAGLGNINASMMLFPVLMTTATAFATAMKTIVFPLIILSAILNLANQISGTIKVERLAKFFGQMAQLSLGFILTVFVGILTLRSLYASVMDKVALRTTRFVTDNAIPLVGKMFSDTIEVTAGYVVMLKQALGIFGVIIILGIILFPLIKIAVIALIYKVAAAIAEPLGDGRTAAILETMSTHLFMMLAAVTAVGLMFFIMIAIVVGTTNHLASFS